MNKFLFLILVIGFQSLNSQITFSPITNHNYQPYSAILQGNGTIYYTTNGNDPDLNSASSLNSVNIPITQNIVVKALLKDSNNQLSAILSRPYYIGPVPNVTVFFKPPANWTGVCSYRNYIQPEFMVDFFPPGAPMTLACDGWYKATFSFYKAAVNFDNCGFLGSPLYQEVGVVTEDTVFYDYSSGPITNPPACLLAVNDVFKSVAFVKIFPNPVENDLNIESKVKFTSYDIIDAQGRSIRKGDLLKNTIIISDLSSGLYFVKLKSLSSETNIIKFIKK